MTLTRREFMRLSVLAAGSVALPAFADEEPVAPIYDFEKLPSLRVLAQKSGIDYGAAVRPGNLAREVDFAAAVVRECSIIVPENDLKWAVLRPQAETWNFTKADRLLEFADTHGMKMRGHTLVWHNALPRWAAMALAEKIHARDLLEEHIHTVVGRYRGKIVAWDVVNEAININDGAAHGLRLTPWLKVLGPAYIEDAFRFAAEADPGAKLIYNDYGAEFSGDKPRAILDLLRRLRDRNVPLHGVGIQAHLNAGGTISRDNLSNFCREAHKLGLEISITELDVKDASLPDDIAARDQTVAADAKEFLDTVFDEVRPAQILTWGLSDRHSWLQVDEEAEGRGVRSLPLDEDCRRTPFWSILYERLRRD